jgi:hypothetical protein
MKMKQHMTQHVDEHRNIMFRESTNEVKGHLKKMCCKIEEEMSNKAEEVFTLMRRDYMTVITGAHVPEGKTLPKAERLARSEIARIAQEVERRAEIGEGYEGEGEGAGGNGVQERSDSQAPKRLKEKNGDELMGGTDAGQDPNEHTKSEGEEAAEKHEREVKPEPMEE